MKKIFLISFIFLSLYSYSQEDDFMVPDSESQEDALKVDSTGVEDGGAPSVVPVVPEGVDPALEGFYEDIQYSWEDKRDPFFPFLMLQKIKIVNERQQTGLEPLQQFALSELKLVGIIWDVGKPKALIVDPSGKSHIVTESAKMGKEFGYVAAIREGEIIVIEEQLDANAKRSFLTKILKINSGVQ